MNRRNDSDQRGPDEDVIREASERFNRTYNWESTFRGLYVDDLKFYHADSDNGWQWPYDLKKEREGNKRPALTINKIRPKVNLIVNEAYKNKAGIKISPVDKETSFDAAQAYEAVVRQIEYYSSAPQIYNNGTASAVRGGIGWWRVSTRFCDEDSFDQEIVILPVDDHLGVFLDPDAKQPDKSDAKFGFVFSQMDEKAAEKKWPNAHVGGDQLPVVQGPTMSVREGNIVVAEYYRIVTEQDELIYAEDPDGNAETFLKSESPKLTGRKKDLAALLDRLEAEGGLVKRRKVERNKLEWYKIAGDRVVERNKYNWSIIPLVCVVGIEDVVDGKLVRYGHVRTLKDPQRMYNYNSSGQVEFGALATRIPFVGPKAAFEGNEELWNEANKKNLPYLPYNDWDAENNRAINKPEQTQGPGVSQAFLSGMQVAEHEMDMASGQYEASDGRQGNERSGKAINERQRQGDTATYHFIDSQAIAIAKTGKIILDMFPHVYDTERVIKVMNKDGTQNEITVNPEQDELIQQQKQNDVLQVMFNPKLGKYTVQADVGPSYATARQAAWDAFVQLVGVNGELYNEIGDLMFRSADFPLADKIAERLTRKIRAEKPYLFDDNSPTPMQQQLQQQVQELSQQVSDALHALAKKDLELVSANKKRDIDAYRAETDRAKALMDAIEKVEGVPPILKDLLEAIVRTFGDIDTDPDLTAHIRGEDDGEQPPVPGAQKAPDGSWYVKDPETEQYLRVDTPDAASSEPPAPQGPAPRLPLMEMMNGNG